MWIHLSLLILWFQSVPAFFLNIPKMTSSSSSWKIKMDKNGMDGFYGMIGPDMERKNTKSILDLFMGNGIIQGVFIKNGTITYVNNAVETEKRVFENKRYRSLFPPNMIGVANTALFHHRNFTYALFERDVPYIIDIDFRRKRIRTVGKYNMEDISHFSAHSKKKNPFLETVDYKDPFLETVDYKDPFLETVDYDVLQKKVRLFTLDSFFRVLSSISIPVKYVPMVHDFISTPKSMIFLNSPFLFRISPFPLKMNVKLDVTKSAIFYWIDREKNNQIQRYYVNHAIYIFHYAEVEETPDEMIIYAPVHDSLDLSTLNISGKYRKIRLDKRSRTVKIERNPALEDLKVEFPVSFQHQNKTKVLLRYVKDGGISTGFILCHQLELEKQIEFPNLCICGEPAVVFMENVPYALFFTIDAAENGYFNVLNLETEENSVTPIEDKMKIGFHSLFLPDSNVNHIWK